MLDESRRILGLPKSAGWQSVRLPIGYRLGNDPTATEPDWPLWFYDLDTWGEYGVREVFTINYRQFDWWKR